MSEPIKIDHAKVDHKLPPHELNARRNRKRTVTRLPGVAQLTHPHQDEQASPNDTVYNPATNPLNNHD